MNRSNLAAYLLLISLCHPAQCFTVLKGHGARNARHFCLVDTDRSHLVVIEPTPDGLNWGQIRAFIHGIVNGGSVFGINLVKISLTLSDARTTFIHADRLLCAVIGACMRAGECGPK